MFTIPDVMKINWTFENYCFDGENNEGGKLALEIWKIVIWFKCSLNPDFNHFKYS